jgi:rhamnosyltransferase
MATYNGGLFLKEQIQSLLNQSYKNWNLIIHDDGSNDDTVSIIKEFQAQDNRIKSIDDDVQFRNASKNFLHLLKFSSAPLIIFCDQDDYWLPEKLATLVGSIPSLEVPFAAYCNAFIWKGNKVSNVKAIKFQRSNLQDTLFLNSGVQGSSLMFNRILLEKILPLPEYVFMHDHLITLAVVTFGELKYINQSLMYYRQHDENVTGTIESNKVKRIANFFFKGRAVIEERHFDAILSFYYRYQKLMDSERQRLFNAYIRYAYSTSMFERLRIVLKHDFTIGRNRLILIAKTILRKSLARKLCNE